MECLLAFFSATDVNTMLGLGFELIGVLLIWLYGVCPPTDPNPDSQREALEVGYTPEKEAGLKRKEQESELKRSLNLRLSKIGLGLAIIGFLLQTIGFLLR